MHTNMNAYVNLTKSSKKRMLIKNKYRKNCHATAIGNRRCSYVRSLTIYRRISTGLLGCLCSDSDSLPNPTPFLSRFGKMARLIVGEKARCRIESYHIIPGKFEWEKPTNNQLVLLMGLALSLIYFTIPEDLELNGLPAFTHWGRYNFVYNS